MKAESEYHPFLVFRYPGMTFFVNRNSVETSLFLEPGRQSRNDGFGKGFSADISFGGESLITYDLARFLEAIGPVDKTGSEEPGRPGGVALILPVSGFSPADRSTLEDIPGRRLEDRVSETRVAVAMGRHGETESIPLREIRLFSPSLRGPLRGRGLLGCRFPGAGECHWFLDLGRIWMNAFRNAAGDMKVKDGE
ncbi:MAG: hypothetical protein ACOC3W_02410 [Thermodesulfobacteriota bacterium]